MILNYIRSSPNLTVFLLVVFGALSKVFMKFQTIPMYNYPQTVNLVINIRNVILTTIVILLNRVKEYMQIRRENIANEHSGEQTNILEYMRSTMRWASNKDIILIGFLDAFTLIMLVFANTYLPGNLVVLLSQVIIPVSLIIDRILKKQHGHDNRKYIGAILIVLGLTVTIASIGAGADKECVAVVNIDENCSFCEDFSDEMSCEKTRDQETGDSLCEWKKDSDTYNGQQHWSFAMVIIGFSTYASTYYKAKFITRTALGDPEQSIAFESPVYFFGWISRWQLVFAVMFTPMFRWVHEPEIDFVDVPSNVGDGFQCLFGTNSIEDTCNPDECGHGALTYINLFLLFNLVYNILVYTVIEVPGSDDVIWFAMTIIIPICNITYNIPGIPDERVPSASNIVSLLLVVGGAVLYRKSEYWDSVFKGLRSRNDNSEISTTDPLLGVSGHDITTVGTLAHCEATRRESISMCVTGF
uniref:EamA domain-containing protein n=1 Tax=Leptocylindrus danicus TaxID=163516 RepID=A0A7S2LM55_9STRA|mmetsp:Transcript_7480/g.11130  ORF Transcript_7480/g.11130 Transcript_7480/m.11130 type:complete len:471 (+) Transcript_7480:85-1497(+)|eukprot:CAMPEP_0116015648 /NCGR_PEP_ID=MMETSP0321-20121206/6972_1 /TAXON_ID=163516 /ORGANISM="Leptocylindrus danicus var. danicus, Strain B650" /LENGTH=470 /DNA_ID=CAMNT_0003485479 /DNA_START=61 /DNA_END=1473 /DNA_ORIENTATION=-